ncbi:hypothetical protein Golob_017989, partial [Gossypium lobatum]|nr:hypothetical protein [Gossypium lobatum]
ARNLIENGLIYRIRSGEAVNIWNDLWLPSPGNTRVLVNSINAYWRTVSY